MKSSRFLEVFVVAAGILSIPVLAFGQAGFSSNVPVPDVPHVISYQGFIESLAGTPIPDGVHRLSIRLYSDAHGTDAPIWQENEDVQITNGIFNILLGGDKPLPSIESMGGPTWLGVSVEGDAELPRTELTASPYALTVPNGSITAAKMGTPFVGSISINGTSISSPGGNINFTSGSGISLAYDPTTNEVLIDAKSTSSNGSGKGSDLLSNTVKTITGTQNQILANGTYGTQESNDVTLTLPQNINTGASPSFNGLTLSGKATSSATSSSDASTTLTTKGYVDNAISTETTARESADDSLRTNLSSEISTRTSQASTYLLLNGTRPMAATFAMGGYAIQNAADPTNPQDVATKNYVDLSAAALQSSLNTESSARTSGDNALSTSLTNEITRAGAAETTLQSNISAETSARQAADNTLTTNLNSEIATRTSQASTYLLLNGTRPMAAALGMDGHAIQNVADPTNAQDVATKNYVDNSSSTLQSALNTESSARTAGDNTLTTNLTNEITRAEAEETTLQSNIDAETSARETADNTLTTNLNSEIATRTSQALTYLLLDGSRSMTGSLDVGGNSIHDLIDPANSTDAATKNYIDTIISGLSRVFIQNGTSQQTANFNISGSGTIGGNFSMSGGSILDAGTTGSTPASGTGVRLEWIPSTASFRAGYASSTQWDNSHIGFCSAAMGNSPLASGAYSLAFGYFPIASGTYSVAMGAYDTALNTGATALGYATLAAGAYSTSLGYYSMAMGTASVALGRISTASGAYATALGNFVTASGNMSTALGSQAVASGSGATAIGNTTTASGTNSTAMGQHANTNSHQGAFVYGDNSSASDILAGADNEFDARAAGGVNFYTASDLSKAVSFSANGGLTVTGGGISADNAITFGGALQPSGSAGTSGQVLASAGSGNPPTWVTAPHWVSVPGSSSASGNPGDEAYDANYLYVCVSANTWKRVALSSW